MRVKEKLVGPPAAGAGVHGACRFFQAFELPRVAAWLAPLEAGDRTVLDLSDEWL